MYSLIISGGIGTRLWPFSRATSPKQLIAFDEGRQSLLQETYLRVTRTVSPARTKIVTSSSYDHQVLAQIQEITPDFPAANLLSEPVGKDSAPAILWGALRILREDPDAVAAVVWSDQLIRNGDNFDSAVARAGELVREGGLVAIGVRPTHAATGLGYIKAGVQVAEGVFTAEKFIEKPAAGKAAKMLADGGYSWNAGIFVFNLRTLLAEFERLAPDMIAAFRERGGDAETPDWPAGEEIEAIYAHVEKNSIDYAILEKTDQLMVMPTALDWSDMGAWDVIHAESPKDEQGNSSRGNVFSVDTRNTLVWGGKRLVTTLGVEDLIVVDTDDALLVCGMAHVQDVKKLVEMLKARGRPQVDDANTIARPWGSFTILSEGAGYKVKMIEVNPRQKLSLQTHDQRAEHWMVLSGTAQATIGDERITLKSDDHVHIPTGAKHRLENPGGEMLRIVEVQFGNYLGEDDIVRYEDNYGRA